MNRLYSARLAALLTFTFPLGACSSGLPYMQNGNPLHHVTGTGAGKISHVVYIVQENRSFDDMFHGYPGADTVDSGAISTGEKIKLRPVPLNDQYVIDHSADAMFAACHAPVGDLPG
ncbi:MAG TPA: hypothetical protein VGI15_01225, partial [Candidatus Cybelea sp.]